jgi:hypothetical protein
MHDTTTGVSEDGSTVPTVVSAEQRSPTLRRVIALCLLSSNNHRQVQHWSGFQPP